MKIQKFLSIYCIMCAVRERNLKVHCLNSVYKHTVNWNTSVGGRFLFPFTKLRFIETETRSSIGD